MSGYIDCACRDCFDIAIGESGALCNACETAKCEPYPADADPEFHDRKKLGPSYRYECQRDDAYGVETEG